MFVTNIEVFVNVSVQLAQFFVLFSGYFTSQGHSLTNTLCELFSYMHSVVGEPKNKTDIQNSVLKILKQLYL